MKNAFLLISMFLNTFCYAQTNYEAHSQYLLDANRASEKNEHDTALILYTKAFNMNGANAPIEYVKAARSAAEIKDNEQCASLLKEAVVKEKIELNTILSFSDNKIFKACAEEIKRNYRELVHQFYSNIENPDVYFKLQYLLNRDHFSRKVSEYYLGVNESQKEEAFEMLSDPQVKKDSVMYNKYRSILFPTIDPILSAFENKACRYADSLNIVELIDITNEHGWQNEAWLLLWHQRGTFGEDNWVWNYFKPQIDQEIAQGKIPPYFWAMFEDIDSIYKTGKSIYGYHPGKVDPITVNSKRKEIGLPALNSKEIEERNNNPFGGKVF